MPSDRLLEKFADVVVQIGLDIQQGDRLIIEMMGSPTMTSFARLLADSAYSAGAENVDVVWLDDYLLKSRFAHGRDAAVEAVTGHSKLLKNAADVGDSRVVLFAPNPGLLAGVNPEKVSRFNRVNNEYKASYTDKAMSHSLHWCIVGVPTPEWAKAVFPELAADEAVEKLWEAVLRVCRITEDDPVGAWGEHIRQLEAKATLLTRRQFDALRYEAPGTDLTLGLPENHVWNGSEARSPHGRTFNPNIPTEEIFTAPHRLRGDGVVTSTKPLILNQVLVEEFVLEVENGRVVNASATSGQEVLDQVLQQDDGASHFGEVALVPQSSLVASANLKWQHPLFDENDASHIALGRAFPISISDARDKTQEQLIDAGLNTSSVHEDFVVGSRQLNVHGVHKDGSETPLLRDGEWAIDP